MEEDSRSIKELIMAVLEKCKDALPELALITQKIDRITANGSKEDKKVRKKDCLNPTFLIKLSECG